MKHSTLAFALLFIMAGAQAQLYKWVAPDGTVSYSDKPPPATAAKVERKSYGSSGPSLADLPFEVAQAAKDSPVTIYTMANCAPCDNGRKLLTDRGIPFSEKTISGNDDLSQLNKLTGSTQLPVLAVGRNKQMGFEPGQWGGALTAAGYPTSNKLPSSYSNPAPEPLSPKVAPPAAKAPKPGSDLPSPPPPTGNAPPDFHF